MATEVAAIGTVIQLFHDYHSSSCCCRKRKGASWKSYYLQDLQSFCVFVGSQTQHRECNVVTIYPAKNQLSVLKECVRLRAWQGTCINYNTPASRLTRPKFVHSSISEIRAAAETRIGTVKCRTLRLRNGMFMIVWYI